MARVRLGIVGCGGMSKAHLHGFYDLDERMQVTALVDVMPEKAAAAAALFAGARAVTDFREILDDVDALLLSLPHHLHHPIGMTCLKAGKHVLMEKPMANTEAECLDLIAAAEEAGVTLMVGYVMRYHPLAMEMKRLLQEKTYGDVFHVSLWTEQLTICSEERMPWAMDHRTLGGGQLFSHGCHYIDLLLWYLGNPVEGAHIGTNLGTPWMDWEGTSDVSIRFEDGSVGYHMGTWGARGSRLRYAFHAHCTEGMLEADFAGNRLLVHTGFKRHTPGQEAEDAETETVLMEAESAKRTHAQILHFLDCIETGALPRTSARDSLQSLRVIWRLYEAERAGKLADLRGLGLVDFPHI